MTFEQLSGANCEKDAVAIFHRHGGTLRMSAALRLGISRRILYAMLAKGNLERIALGTYRLVDLPPLAHPDFSVVAVRIPRGVICLISALAHYDLTTEVPHAVDLALEKGHKAPKMEYPPIRYHWFSGIAFHEGIELSQMDGVFVRMYGPEKTIADMFKARQKLGFDVALEALKCWRQQPEFNVERLLYYARICRVEMVMRPYVEAIL